MDMANDAAIEWAAEAVEIDWLLDTPGASFGRVAQVKRLRAALGDGATAAELEDVRWTYWQLWSARMYLRGRDD